VFFVSGVECSACLVNVFVGSLGILVGKCHCCCISLIVCVLFCQFLYCVPCFVSYFDVYVSE
jgi:hypothetical protein